MEIISSSILDDYIQIPYGNVLDALQLGTYNLEITETVDDVSSSKSVTFLWHTKIKNIETQVESICVGESIDFLFNNSTLSTNYKGSFFKLDFGDGSDNEFYTIPEIFIDNYVNDNVHKIDHTYDLVSCGIENDADQNASFEIDLFLYNKFRIGSEGDCNDYIQNGALLQAQIQTGYGPEAMFIMEDNYCIGSTVTIENTSIFGEYGINTECSQDAKFYWSVRVNDEEWTPINPQLSSTFSDWLVGESDIYYIPESDDGYIDLQIPSTSLTTAGCWQVKLVAQNLAVCTAADEYIYSFDVEENIEPDFEILNSSNNTVNQNNGIYEICAGETVNFDDTTEYEECDGSSFEWFITSAGPDNIPNTGDELNPTEGVDYTYVENNTGIQTSSTSQEPFVQFFTPDTYLITQQITNSCGTFTSNKLLLVKGSPFVELPLESDNLCKYPSEIPYLINFETNEQYKPTYSESPYEPSTYEWVITGANGNNVTSSDYTFIGGTSSSSEFPQIEFNSFLDYNIQIIVDGECSDASNDFFILKLNEIPVITNETTSEIICSGSPTDGFVFTSSMEDETSYAWQVIEDETSDNVSGYITSGSGNIPSQNSITISDSSVGTITYSVTPSTAFCTGESNNFTITINPAPVIQSFSETICEGDTFSSILPVDVENGIVPSETTYTWEITSNSSTTKFCNTAEALP